MTLMKRLEAKRVTAVSALTILCAALVWPVASVAENTAPDPAGQRIQLDPETGEVLPQSAGQAKQPARRVEPGAKPEQANDRRTWTTDGVQMLTPNSADAPTAHATQCPDGSLRIGHAPAGPDESARHALCADGDE